MWWWPWATRRRCAACRRSNYFQNPRTQTKLVFCEKDQRICILCESAAGAFFIQIENIVFRQAIERHADHADGSVNDPGAGRDHGLRLLPLQHGSCAFMITQMGIKMRQTQAVD